MEGGWTVIQSRGQFQNAANYFYKGWADYVKGFGVPGKPNQYNHPKSFSVNFPTHGPSRLIQNVILYHEKRISLVKVFVFLLLLKRIFEGGISIFFYIRNGKVGQTLFQCGKFTFL
jgi:hypothetical protein